jgi:hypothetical protein
LTTIDDFTATTRVTVGAIKIDVEGYDGYVLEGARNLLARDAPTLLVEYSPVLLEQCNYPVERFAQAICSLRGYCFWVDERHHTLVPVEGLSDLLHIRWSRHSSSNILVTVNVNAIAHLIRQSP